MLNLARANLKVKLYSIDEASLSEHQKQIYATVKEMLNAPAEVSAITEDRGWDGIYQAESSIALLYSGERLRQEIDACLHDLRNLNEAEAHTLRLDYQRLVKHAVDGSTAGSDDTTLIVYLLRLMEGIHWNKKKRYVVGELYAQATRRILWCILVSFVLLILPYIAVNVFYEPNNLGWWWSMLILWTALTAGLFGAFFFRLTDLKNRSIAMGVDEMALQRRWSYTLLRAGVGVCGALVVYFFLRSVIVEVTLVPKFEEIRIDPVKVSSADTSFWMSFMVPSKAMALFTIWCFLAGYSEKLVPGILSGAEGKLH